MYGHGKCKKLIIKDIGQ